MPAAFETVGHIAHLNLREELLPFKHLIGQVRPPCFSCPLDLPRTLRSVRRGAGGRDVMWAGGVAPSLLPPHPATIHWPIHCWAAWHPPHPPHASANPRFTHTAHRTHTQPHTQHTRKAPPFAPLVQVLLDKNPRLRTVVNKVGSIGNEYRVFDMELLAGEGDTVTEVRQHGLRFRLDFARVIEGGRGGVFLFDMELT